MINEDVSRTSRHGEKASKRERTPEIYWYLESATEFLIFAVLIFSPWAFGTTEDWAISSVNTLNYVLGGLWIGKWLICAVTGYRPERWNQAASGQGTLSKWITGAMAALTVLVLGYIALSAWNARAEFLIEEMRFEYIEKSRDWLPRSYDKSSTWRAFQTYLAAACFFWALRDWLRTKTRREARPRDERESTEEASRTGSRGERRHPSHHRFQFPERLKRLLWFLCINGGVLALEGTLQRLSGTGELLWLVRPQMNEVARAQFGPFNYRSNGAQYLNMLWPVGLGFWWALHRQRQGKLGQGPEMILLLLTGIMLAAPIIANSRGGVAVAIIQAIFAIGIFGFAFRKGALWKTLMVSLIFLIIVGSAVAFQWKSLQSRMAENTFNTLSGRTEIYENAKKIANDFPIWGAGPGAFTAMYSIYRDNPNQLWFAQAHDDYLQTRATFGTVGLLMIMALVILVFAYPIAGRGVPVSTHFTQLVWTAAGGCLLHAKFDFPFQIYSLLLVFLTLCAIMGALGKK